MTVTRQALQETEIFRGFTKQELTEIAKLCYEESHADCVNLFEEGGPAKKLYLIVEGKISLEKRVQLGRSGSSRRATVSIQGPGQVIGWSSLVPPLVYTMTGVCLEPVKLLVIDGDDLRQLMNRDSKVGLKLMDAIAALVKERMEITSNTLTYFLSIISHELKSPIAAIESYMEVMLGGFVGKFTDKQSRMLERSALRLKDLRALINDILDLARMQPEHVQADFDWLDPIEISTEALEDVRLAAHQKDINLQVDIPSTLQQIVGARRRLRQIISNLLTNAIKFSPERSEVTLRVREEPGQLAVEISDEGIGIATNDQEHIFRDFFRGRNVGEVGGTGLGLSIVKKIVDAHHGQISIESPYDSGKSGTKFTVTIPRNLPTPAMKHKQQFPYWQH